MNPVFGLIIAGIAGIVASAALALSATAMRRKTSADETARLEGRVDKEITRLERRLEEVKGDLNMAGREYRECEKGRINLLELNARLVSRIERLEGRENA